MTLLEVIYISLLGVSLGSFTTVLVYRVPRGMSWVFASSYNNSGPSTCWSVCPKCEVRLCWRDLIPVLSWLYLRGKCAHCHVAIPKRYITIEFTVLFAILAVYFFLGLTPEAFFMMSIIPFLCALIVIDLEHMILPDQLVAVVGGIGVVRLVYMVLSGGFDLSLDGLLFLHIAGAVLFAGLSWCAGWLITKILKRDALGFGDVKFFAVAGLWLGLPMLSSFYFLSGVLGVVLGVVWQKLLKRDVFPFGPALIASLYILLLLKTSLFV